MSRTIYNGPSSYTSGDGPSGRVNGAMLASMPWLCLITVVVFLFLSLYTGTPLPGG